MGYDLRVAMPVTNVKKGHSILGKKYKNRKILAQRKFEVKDNKYFTLHGINEKDL